ncbi:MAG: pyridoxal phosphate-dependent aminotransferase [Chromatiales bacterium]|nr:pyridoxal phosphate-dependent aminotransferase [Chromatiales bacterium]
MTRLARRTQDIQPFHVMDLLAKARALEAAGHDIVHLEIGEPDFAAPVPVIDAARSSLSAGQTRYTPALGLGELREAIAGWYATRYGLSVDPERVVVTPGSSGALQLATLCLVNPGDEVLLADPGYPCNRHFVRAAEGVSRSLPVDAGQDFQLSAESIATHWGPRTVAALVASPSNPTGTRLDEAALRDIVQAVESRQGSLIADEIYHGLEYGERAISAAAVSKNAFVINSFSKYFGMTGFRVGWLLAPPDAVREAEKLAQNLFLAAPTTGQYAALAAFLPQTLEILEERREIFRQRRDFLLPALRDLGFEVPKDPEGAFYIYAGCGGFSDDSYAFSNRVLAECGVAITPGIDFGEYLASSHVRFAYTTSMDKLEQGVERLSSYLRGSS